MDTLFLGISHVVPRRHTWILCGKSAGKRAKEYAGMLLEDLKKDTAMLGYRKKVLLASISQTDTLVEMVTRRGFKNIPADSFYFYNGSAINVTLRKGFAEATIQQLKSSGSIRYFSDLTLKKKISEYDIVIREFGCRKRSILIKHPSLLTILLNWRTTSLIGFIIIIY